VPEDGNGVGAMEHIVSHHRHLHGWFLGLCLSFIVSGFVFWRLSSKSQVSGSGFRAQEFGVRVDRDAAAAVAHVVSSNCLLKNEGLGLQSSGFGV
jgi:peptidoglycan/LPS O-acetylase OafA/YrhL